MSGSWATGEFGIRKWTGEGLSAGWVIVIYPDSNTVYADNGASSRGKEDVNIDLDDGFFCIEHDAPYDGTVRAYVPADVMIELLRLRGLIPELSTP